MSETTNQKLRIIAKQESLFFVGTGYDKLMVPPEDLMSSYAGMALALEHGGHVFKVVRALYGRSRSSTEGWMQLSGSVHIAGSRGTPPVSYTVSHGGVQINVEPEALTTCSGTLLKLRWEYPEKKYRLFTFISLLGASVVGLWRYMGTVLLPIRAGNRSVVRRPG